MNCQWMFRYGVCKPQWVTNNFQIWFLISWQHKGQSIWRHVMKSLLTSIFFSQWSMNLNMITGISATVLTLLGKFCITFAFAAIYIYTCELFPTILYDTLFLSKFLIILHLKMLRCFRNKYCFTLNDTFLSHAIKLIPGGGKNRYLRLVFTSGQLCAN